MVGTRHWLNDLIAAAGHNAESLAHEIGVAPYTVYRWKAGEMTPGKERAAATRASSNRKKLAAALGVPVDLLDERFDAEAKNKGLRDSLPCLPGTAAPPALVQADFWQAQLDRSAVQTHRQLEDAFAGLYRGADPRVVMPFARAYADSLFELLDQPMSEPQRIEIGAIAVGVHAQVGLWACHMNRPRIAHRYLSASCDVADNTGDPHLRACALAACSYLFSSAPSGGSAGRPDLALQLLAQALELAQDADKFTKGWFLTWRADQYATLGNLSAAREDIDLADKHLQAMEDGRLSGFFSRSRYGYGMVAHLNSVRGLVFALAGDTLASERTFEHVQATASNARRRIATHGHAALAHTLSGRPQEACAVLMSAIVSAAAENYAMGLERAIGVRARFVPNWENLACVRDIDEQLQTVRT